MMTINESEATGKLEKIAYYRVEKRTLKSTVLPQAEAN
jgi:hypothetical protein